MKFINQTDYQAESFWGPAGDDEMGVVVIAKGTYEIINGELNLTQDNPWPVHFDNLETPYGMFYSEYNIFCKPRIDFIVCGNAYAPRGRPVQQMDVDISVGENFKRKIRIFGDRTWKKHLSGHAPTEPEYFTQMPLTLDHAFGGKVENEWGEFPCPSNPNGKGFCFDDEPIEGTPLPNIESPNHLIRDPKDDPPPFAPCPYPLEGKLRLTFLNNSIEEAMKNPYLFLCNANPYFIVEEPLNSGETISIKGISSQNQFTIRIPEFTEESVVRCDARRTTFPLRLDTIIVQGEENRAVFRWRGGTKFPIKPREKRSITLRRIEED